MSNNDIRNIVILGATGPIGIEITKALLVAGSPFEITAVRRVNASTPWPFPPNPHLQEITVDYTSTTSLKQAFLDQHAIIEAFNPSTTIHQERIIQAAIKTPTIKHIITPDFSSDTFHQNAEELLIFEPKIRAQRILEGLIGQRDDLHWTAIITGPFFDWAIPKNLFWISPTTHKVTIFGSGNQRISMSKLDMVGRATLAVLTTPENYLDRPAYFADYTISSNEVLSMLNETHVDGQPWTVNAIALDGWLKTATQLWEKDTADGVEDRLNSTAYRMLGTYGLFDEENQYGADFSDRVEARFGMGREEFVEVLRSVVG
ncbi:NAD(P)-binding protein [Aspergillus sclerotioniger CBS 115572]|uniref:NAD(P)-binding protein n=1 Tax=Aspergillus sclerotioniger CBS 115572 TaxID=1450535 RepID=A0A317XDU2_9EURO|nr:NAD(P)-binding protein [Aspergillus sclerotioniger CBS 115572]PWY96495.1 NAD(P)-binding protein [Aspergillus sclerotioniger CBS 115572]